MSRRTQSSSFGLTAIMLCVAFTAGCTHGGSGARGAAQIDRIVTAFRSLAGENGEPAPAQIQYVAATAAAAERALYGSDGVENGARAVIGVVAHGSFIGYGTKQPAGQAPPRGSILTEIVSASDGQVLDWGISDRVPDLSALGRVKDAP